MNPRLLYDASAETAVLGCMLSMPLEVIPEVGTSLQREDFFVPAHREIFRVLVAMFEKMKAIDVLTVHHQLAQEKLDANVGSPGILAELLVGFASHLNVSDYIQIVKDKAKSRFLVEACKTIVQSVQDGLQSIEETLADAETSIAAIGKQGQRGRILSAQECVDKYRVRREGIQIGEVVPRIPTGIRALDRLNGGLPIPSYVGLAGEMASGKSAIMLEILKYRCANQLGGVGIFSLEMTPEQIINRFVGDKINIDTRRLDGKIHPQEEESEAYALQEIERWNFHIDPTTGMGPSDFRRGTRQMVAKGCNLIFLDNAQLAKGSSDKQERHLQLMEISRTIQELYKEHEITFVVLLQVKQDKKGGLLGMYDLADSACWQRDCRVIYVINQVEGEHPFGATPITINIAKFSEGMTGQEPAMYDKIHQRFA